MSEYQLPDRYVCPRCQAPAGKVCRTVNGNRLYRPHRERRALAVRTYLANKGSRPIGIGGEGMTGTPQGIAL